MTWVRRLWDGYEALFARLIGLRPVGPGSLLRVRTVTYRGRPLGSGERALAPGARVLEIHLDNRLIGDLGATGTEAAFRIRQRLRRELPLLHQAMHDAPEPIAGVVGTSLLAFGARGLGFHVERLPSSPGRRWLAVYMRWLARLYRPAGAGEQQRGPHRGRSDIFVTWVTAGELDRLVQP